MKGTETKSPLTPDQQKVYDDVMAKRQAGMITEDAIKEMGVTMARWQYIRSKADGWRRRYEAKKKDSKNHFSAGSDRYQKVAVAEIEDAPRPKAQHLMLPISPDGPMILVIGSPKQLSQIVREALQ